jgi:hypothetical protein
MLEKGHDGRGIQHAELIGYVCQSRNTRNPLPGSFQNMADDYQGIESDQQE